MALHGRRCLLLGNLGYNTLALVRCGQALLGGVQSGKEPEWLELHEL